MIIMTRFRLTCTSDYRLDSLRNYVRLIEKADIPGLTLEYEDLSDEDWVDPDVYVTIETLDTLLQLRKVIDINIILLDDDVLEIYDDWRE